MRAAGATTRASARVGGFTVTIAATAGMASVAVLVDRVEAVAVAVVAAAAPPPLKEGKVVAAVAATATVAPTGGGEVEEIADEVTGEEVTATFGILSILEGALDDTGDIVVGMCVAIAGKEEMRSTRSAKVPATPFKCTCAGQL